MLGSIQRVVLQPYQFSSFNKNDPNADKWPDDSDNSFGDVCHIALRVWIGSDSDNTDGATHYHDTSIGWPKAWGDKSAYVNTLNIGKLRFYKLAPQTNHEAVQDASTAL